MRRRMYVASKKEDAKRSALLKKAVQFCLASGMIAMPWVGSASEITRTDGGANINGTGVHNIYAGKDIGNGVGASTFSKFNVTSGDVANMHFRTSATSTTHFNTLLNFVDSRIDINGTVNAIRNGGVGGHLYFLSPAGMAVGANGAINAGSLTVMTPTNDWWGKKFDDNGVLKSDALKAIQGNTVPINATGTISVLGTINTTDNICIRAGKINIGQGGVNPHIAAKLNSGVVDFTSVVKLDASQQAAAGVTNLTATRAANGGDIILAAEVSYNANSDMDEDNVNAELNVAGGSQIKAYRNADLTATALNNSSVSVYRDSADAEANVNYIVNGETFTEKEFNEKYGSDNTTTSFRTKVSTSAVINITDDSSVQGRNVNVVAKAQNVMSNGWTNTIGEHITQVGMAVLLNGFDACSAILSNKAEVNIAKDVTLHATGLDGGTKALNVQALATNTIKIGTWTGSLNLLGSVVPALNCVPTVNVNYASGENQANVDIKGKLTADAGSINVGAIAKNSITSTAESGLFGSGLIGNSDAVISFGLNGVDGYNKSNLTIGQDAVINAAGDVELDSHAISSIIAQTSVVTTEKSTMAFGIGWLDYDNIAKLEVGGKVTSQEGKITLDGAATYTDNTFYVSTDAGQTFVERLAGKALNKTGIKQKVLDGLGGKLADLGIRGVKNVGNGDGEAVKSLSEKLADYLKLGITFAYMDEENTSDVYIKSTGSVESVGGGDITINSKAHLDDLLTYGAGTTNNKESYTPGESSAPSVLVNGSIFLRKLTNQGNLTIDARTDGTPAAIKGGKITMAAGATAPYNRVDYMKKFLSTTEKEVAGVCPQWNNPTDESVKVLKRYYEAAMAEKTRIEAEMYDEKGELKPEYADKETGSAKMLEKMDEYRNSKQYKEYYRLITEGKYTEGGQEKTISNGPARDVMDVLSKGVLKLANPQNYFNYSVSGEVDSRDSKEGGASKFAVGVSFGMDTVNNNARILFGDNTFVDASEGLDISTDAYFSDINCNGGWNYNSAGTSGANMDVITIQELNVNSIVAATEGSKLYAGAENLNVTAKDTVKRVNIAKPLVLSEGTTVVVDFNYFTTESNTLISLDDETELQSDKTISLNGSNTTGMIVFTGALASGGNGGAISVAISNIYRNNIVAVADNDGAGALAQTNKTNKNTEATDLSENDDEETRMKKLLAEKSGLSQDKTISFYSNDLNGTGSIEALALDSKATTNGKIGNFVVDIALAKTDDNGGDSLLTKITDWMGTNVTNIFKSIFKKANNDEQMNEMQNLGNNDGEVGGDVQQNHMDENGNEQQDAPNNNGATLSLAGAASVGVLKLDAVTASVIKNVGITLGGGETKLSNSAKDDSLLVAAAGGVAISKVTKLEGGTGNSGVLSGAVSVSDVNSKLKATIANCTINGAKIIDNLADREGVLANAAAAVSYSSGNQGMKNHSFAFGATANLAEYVTEAKMFNNQVNTEGTLDTKVVDMAVDKDIQITGGIDVNIAKGGQRAFGLGGFVSWAYLNNTVNAIIDSGSYDQLNSLAVEAVTDLTQINAAIGIGVSNSTNSSYAFQGALVYAKLKNDVKADVKSANIIGNTMQVAAYDTNLTKDNAYDNALKQDYGFDVDGKTYTSHAQKQTEDTEKNKTATLQDKGNLIVSAAVEVAAATGGTGGAAAGASAVIGIVDNDFNSIVEGSTITLAGQVVSAGGVDVYPAKVWAESSTLEVGVAAGGNGSQGGFAGGGSAVVNLFKNDVYAKVEGSTFNVAGLQVDAKNKQKLVNVAGQIDIGKNAIGLDMVYNYMLNNTGAYFTNSSIAKITVVEGQNIYGVTNLVLDANNDSDIYAIALGVSANTNVDSFIAANGSVAVNRGQNNVEAVAEKNASGKKDLIGLKTFTVHSKDDSYMVAATGGLTVSVGKTAFGGALTWNRLGSLTEGSTKGKMIDKDDNKKQVNKAIVSGYDIHMADNGVLTVKAEDVADFVTVAIGLGIGTPNSSFTLQGANANAYISKETTASIIGGNINQNDGDYQDATHFADVNVSASTDNEFDTVSVVLVTSGKGAIGAALSENTMKADTTANVTAGTNNSSYLAKDMLVKSTSKMDLTNVAVGVAASGKVSVGGSVVDNLISNNTKAGLGSGAGGVTEVVAAGGVGVVSHSEEDFDNYSGQANFTLGTVGGGVALAFNEIKGDTLATAQNAKVSTMNRTGKAIQLHDSIKGTDTGYTGFVVGADALHDLYNAPFCAGLTLAFSGAAPDADPTKFVALGLDVTASDDKISGKTQALLKGVSYNETVTAAIPGDNLTVLATDKMKSKAVVTNAVLSLAIGEAGLGFALGGGVNYETNNRTVDAEVDGDLANNGAPKRKINADKITIKADSDAKLEAINTAVSVQFSQYAGLSFSLGATYTDLNVTTLAKMKGIESNNNGLDIFANHKDHVELTGTGVTLSISANPASGEAAVGVHVDSEDNTSNTQAVLENSNVYHYDNGVSTDNIKAVSDSYVNTQDANITATIAAIGVSVGVLLADNNLTETVKATVSDSIIGTDSKRAKDINVLSENKVNTEFDNQNVSVATIAGIGVGKGVNTINGSVSTGISNSTFYALNDINAKATENISLNGAMASATLGALSVGVSTLHNYVGTAVVANDYAKWVEEKEVSDVSSDQMQQGAFGAKRMDGLAATTIADNSNTLANAKKAAKLSSEADETKTVKIARSETLTNTGDQVNLVNAKLYAGNNITTEAKETVNSDTMIGGGSVGILSIQVEENTQHVTGKVGTTIVGGVLDAGKSISVSSLMTGQLKNDTVQVGIGGIPICVTIGELIKEEGGTDITLNGATMRATKGDISLLSKDDMAILNKGTTVAVGAITATAVDYTARDNSSSTITLKYDNVLDRGNDLEAKSITMSSLSVPNVVSEYDAVNVSLVTGAGVVMESKANNKAALTLQGANRLWSDTLNLESKVYSASGKYSVNTDLFSGAYSLVSVLVNKARAYLDTGATTTVGALTLKTETRKDKNDADYTVGLCDVTINASDLSSAKNSVDGSSNGLVVATGTNYAQTEIKSNVSTIVDTTGSSGIYAKNLTVSANGKETMDTKAVGNGFSIVLNVSPVGAGVETKVIGNTTTTLKGLFVTDEQLRVNAVREDNLKYVAFSKQIGGVACFGTVIVDGFKSKESDPDDNTENTTVNLETATIKSNGNTDITANTIVNVNKDNKTAGGIFADADPDKVNGVVGESVSAGVSRGSAEFQNPWKINSKVNMKGGKIEGAGPINIGAYSSGVMNVFLKIVSGSAGYDGAFSKTNSNVTVNDIITLTNDAEVRTTKVDSDVNIAASDSWELNIRGTAENTAGIAGSTVPRVYHTLERNNKVDIVSGTVFSIHDVNLYAGKKTDGSNADLDLYITATSFNRSLITAGKEPRLTNTIKQNNEIKVQSDGKVQGVRHVQLYADNGREAITKTHEGYGTWENEDYGSCYVSTTAGNLEDAGITRGNQVVVNGSVTAGVANTLNITIGKAGDLVILNKNDRDGIAAATNEGSTVYSDSAADKAKYIYLYDADDVSTKTDSETAASISKLTLDSFIIDKEPYKQTLTQRYDEVQKLMSEYAADGDQTIYNGWKAEAERLKALIDSLNIDLYADNIQYIVIPDLVASGGNVVVNTKNFSGSGSVTAKGSPVIKIKNYTNLTTKVSDVTVDDPGGVIYYKNQALDPEKQSGGTQVTLQAQVKALNADHNKTVETMNAAKGTSASVVIEGLYDGRDINYKIEDDEQPGTYINGSFNPRADVVINGNINSLQGSVSINSAHNNITIEGEEVGDSVSVNGKVVSIVALNGSITQGFTDGIVNVGGDVKSLYASLYNSFVKNNENVSTNKPVEPKADILDWEYPSKMIKYRRELAQWEEGQKTAVKSYDLIKTELKDGQKAPEVVKESDGNVTGNWIAGGQVFINASDININGIVQSGFDYYYVDTSKDTIATNVKIEMANNQWVNNGSKALTDVDVKNSGDLYKVVDGGAYWNATKGCYEYKMNVYYNPYTKQLLTDDIDANGGRIYLTGRISSTGNGKLICLDGAYNVDVKNTLGYDLSVGKLVVNETKGLISITDSLVMVTNPDGTKSTLVTEITSDGAVTKNSKTGQVVSDTHITGSGRNYVYQPTSGLRYKWVEGYKTTSYQKFVKEEKSYWWGSTDFYAQGTDKIDEWTKTATSTSDVNTSDSSPRLDGAYIGIGNGTETSVPVQYTHTGERTTDVKITINDVQKKQSSWWFFKSPHIYQYTWFTKEWGNAYTDSASIKADNPINITFIGTSADKASVNIETTKNLYVNGNIGNTRLYDVKDGANQVIGHVEKGTVNIKSNNASVIQKSGSIYGADVNLSAANDLQYVNITAGDTVNLQGLITAVGSGNITVDAAYGGAKGKVLLKNYGGSKAEYVSLTADGDISQVSQSNLVEANRIDLISGTGSIGAETGIYGTMRVKAGQTADGTDTLKASLNASASGHISIEQVSGNLRVGKVRSENDGILLMVPGGGIIDALPYDAEETRSSDEKLVETWRELGLILNEDGSKSAGRLENEEFFNEAKNKANSYKENAAREYQQYVELKTKKDNYEAYSETVAQEYDQLADIKTKVANDQILTDAEKAIYTKYKNYASAEAYLKWTVDANTFGVAEQSALDGYAAKYSSYNSVAEYLAADAHYQELLTKCATIGKNYTGWDANQLLYAIQDSVINPQTGVKTSTKDVNIYGNDIILWVKDGVGLNSDAVKTVDLTTLGQKDARGNLVHLDDLKALATADASTVKWDNDTNTATIKSRLAIGVQQKKNETGLLTVYCYDNSVSKENNIFMESRSVNGMDADTQNYDLRLNAIYTNNGNVSLASWGNIINSSTGTTLPIIYADNLLLQAGAENMEPGSIGTSAKPMNVQIIGTLTATATGNIDITALGDNDLRIASLAAGKVGDNYSAAAGNIAITAQKDIYLIEQKSDIQGYIRSNTNGSISLTSTEGSIGTKDHVVRILNAGLTDAEANDFSGDSKNKGSIVLSAGKDIYVEGVSTATPVKRMDGETPVKENGKDVYDQEPGGYFKLQSLDAGGDKISITVNGNLVYGGSSWAYSGKDLNIAVAESFDTSKDMKAKNLTITTGNNIQFGAGVEVEASESVTLSAGFAPGITYGPKIKLNAEGGLVYQSEGTSDNITGIKTPTLIVKATTGITLDQHNEVTNVVLQNVQNDVAFTNYSDGTDMLNIAVMHTNTDLFSFDANNVGSYILGNLTIENNAKSTGDKSGIMSIWYGIAAHGNININNDNGMIVNVYDVVSRNGDISMFGSSLLNEGNISAANGGVVLMTSDSLQNLKSSVRNKEDYKIYGKAGVMVFANGDVTNEANITTDNGNIIVMGVGTVEEQNNFGKMTNTGDMLVTNEGDVLFYAGEGVENSGSIVVNDGDVNIRSAKHLNNSGDIATADGIVEIEAKENVDNLGHLVSKKNTDDDAVAVKIKSETGYVSNFGDIYSHEKGNVIINAKTDVDNGGCIVAKNGAVSITAGANINNYGVQALITDIDGIYGTNGVTISANGDVYNGADVYAAGGDINIVGIGYSNTNQSTTGKVVNEGNIYVLDSGNVTFRSNKTVTNTGDIYSLGGGTVELKADGDLDNHGDIFTYDRNNSGTSTAGVSLVSVNGNVINTDDFIVEESVLLKHVLSVPQGVINAQGDILLSAMQGEIRNNKALVATGDITIKSLKSIYIEDASFKNNENLQAALGKTFIKGIKAGGKVTIESTSIYNSMEVTAGKGIELKATAEKDVSNGNVAVAETGVIVVHGNNGKFITDSGDVNVTADGYTVAADYKNGLLTSAVEEKFSIRNLGNNDLITKDGDVHLEGVYSVENVGNIEARKAEGTSHGNVYLKATKGTIYNYETSNDLPFTTHTMSPSDVEGDNYWTSASSNSATAPHSIVSDGNIKWLAQNIYNVAGQYSDGELSMTITEENLHNVEKIVAKKDVRINAPNTLSEVVFGSSITSKEGSVTFDVGGNLSFTGGASIDAAKDIILEVGNNITSAIKLDAGEDVDVHSRGGIITLNDGINSDTGLVRVYSEISTNSNGVRTVSVSGDVTAQEGSIDISSDTGDVVVENLTAKELAGIGTMKGNIEINGIASGKKVAIYTEDKNANFTLDELRATDELILASNRINGNSRLDMSKFMGDNDGFKLYLFGVGGEEASNTKGDYVLDYSKVGGNIDIGMVSVEKVQIITETPVKIEHINVGDRADVTSMGVTSTVYGKAQVYDVNSKVIYYAPGDADVGIDLHPVYFDDPLNKQPYIDQLMADSTQFMNGSGVVSHGPLGASNGTTARPAHKMGGMTLDITAPDSQRGNGILLKNYYGQKTFAQRFSMEEQGQRLNSEKAQDFYNGYFNTGVAFFQTYNLLDIPSADLNQMAIGSQRVSNVVQLATIFDEGGVVVEGTTTNEKGEKVKKKVEYEF